MRFQMGLRVALACVALVSIPALGFGQATEAVPIGPAAPAKVAVINLQQAVLATAEIQKANAEMQAKYKPRADQLDQLQKELESITQQLQSPNVKLTADQQADLQAQGQRKQRDAQRIQEDLQADVDRERNEILQKSTQKMAAVVRKIAEEKGYDLVIDVSTAVFFKPTLEITKDAVAAYDKAYPAK
jgi:outer membrane protein